MPGMRAARRPRPRRATCRRARWPPWSSGRARLAAAGLVANGLAVVLTVALARLLDPQDYGAYASLMALALILCIPGSALLVAVVRHTSGLVSVGLGDRVDPWAARVRRLALVGCGVLAVAAVAAAGRPGRRPLAPRPGRGGRGACWPAGPGPCSASSGDSCRPGAPTGTSGATCSSRGRPAPCSRSSSSSPGPGWPGAAWGLLGANLIATAYGRRALRTGHPAPPAPTSRCSGATPTGARGVALDAIGGPGRARPAGRAPEPRRHHRRARGARRVRASGPPSP